MCTVASSPIRGPRGHKKADRGADDSDFLYVSSESSGDDADGDGEDEVQVLKVVHTLEDTPPNTPHPSRRLKTEHR